MDTLYGCQFSYYLRITGVIFFWAKNTLSVHPGVEGMRNPSTLPVSMIHKICEKNMFTKLNLPEDKKIDEK